MRGLGPRVRLVRAPNPGPMTLDGTNTYVLFGGRSATVIDPGPDDASHREAILHAAAGLPVRRIVTTHGHLDHTEGIAALVQATGAEVGWPEAELDGVPVRVLSTPGHTADSVSLLLPEDGVLFSGDFVLGRGTTVIAAPDGDLGAYLDSLGRVLALAEAGAFAAIAPGHGPVVNDPVAWLRFYRAHRLERLDQIRAALVAGAADPDAVVDAVYPGLAAPLRAAALMSVRAQLDYLARP